MAVNYYYNFAEIDPTMGNMCVGVHTSTADLESETMIPIPVYDEEYIMKYYINGEWYEDEAGTIPWTSSLI